jgi:TonB-dependent starch-binding outer membrane protein SusC
MRKFLLLVAFVLPVMAAIAQTKVIKGRVTDENGNPIANATVSIKETKSSVSTDAGGNYSITADSKARTLVISYVGKGIEEIAIGSRTDINVSLKQEDKALQEVVVVGYGTQRKKTVTASVSKINPNDVTNLVSPSIDKQLAGRAAGVQVTNLSGLVNQEPRIRIRGVNSINYGRDPLIVIDGVPFQTGSVLQNSAAANSVANGVSNTPVSGVSNNTGLSGVANSNPLSAINPNDIESIDVLKDGSATAIYGSRAANGVILITTKRGKQGKMNVNYNMYFGFSRTYKVYDLLNADEFVTIANEKYTNAGQPAQAFLNAERTNTDWQKIIQKENPIAQSHSLSLDGANASTSYYLSLNYLSQDGLIKSNFSKRYGIRMNLSHKINKWLRVGNNLSGSRVDDADQNNGGNSLGGAMAAALRALPNVRVMNPDHPTGYNITPTGTALGQDANLRPIDNNYVNIAFVLDKNKYRSQKYFLTENFFAELTPFAGFTFRSQASVDYQTSGDFLAWDPRHGDGQGTNGRVENINISRNRIVLQNYFNYNKSFGSHNFILTGGTELQRDESKYSYSRGLNISDIFFITDNVISGSFSTQQTGGGYTKSGFVSYFGRLNYDFQNKYFAQVSFRRDGLSSLAEKNRYGNFPGASVGWRISEENFWQNSGLSRIMNEVKIRGSYAVVGNALTGFPYLSTYGLSPYGSLNGIAIAAVGNDALKWETNKKIDVGIDMSFLNNRFNLTFDYFRNQNDGLVLAAPLPSSFGIPGNSIFRNIGDMKNYGIEIAAGGTIVRGRNFSWIANANFTTTRNKVESLYQNQDVVLQGPNNGTFNILRVGQPINALYGFIYAGVNSGNGNPMWLKADGTLIQGNIANNTYYNVIKADDPALGTQTTLATTDRVILGNITPAWFGGLTNTFNYKNWSMELFFRYSGGNMIYNLTRQEALLNMGFQNNSTELLRRWTTAGQQTDVPKVWNGKDNFTNLNSQAASRFAEKGDYFRLQNVVVTYTFNSENLERRSNGIFKSLKLFMQAQNLWVWTKYSGLDPDSFTEFGIDNASVPQARSFSVGFNLGL